MEESLIYFVGLLGMKLFVLFIFQALPWIGWVGDWALRWTEGNEALQIAFVMFIFPVCMNAIQYYIIDGVIKGKPDNTDREGFERVAQDDGEDDDSEAGQRRRSIAGSDDGSECLDEEVVKRGRIGTRSAPAEDLQVANPTPIPSYDEEVDGEASEARK